MSEYDLQQEDLEYAPCGFLTFSDNGQIRCVNNTLLTLLGWEHKSDITNKKVEQLFTIAGRIFYQTYFFPILKLHGKAQEIFFTMLKKNNEEIPVICNAERKEKNGVFINHCALFVATQRGSYEQELLLARRKAEEALDNNINLLSAKKNLEEHSIELDRQLSMLRQVNNDIVIFSKVISHDLQEPLRKIALFADKISTDNKELPAKESAKELEKIKNECKKLRLLSANLERYISLNIAEHNFTETDLNTVINEAFSTAVLSAGYTKTNFAADKLPVIDGLKDQLFSLFFNLFNNCIIYRTPDRQLNISVENVLIQQNSYRTIKGHYRYIDFVKITIKDNGQGFEIKDGTDIFQFRKKAGDANNSLGFGLAFCKKIVDNHFGNIYAESIPEKGTSIKILLPIRQVQ